MYHPYFRGKQYELITIREMAPVLKSADFRPVIEPVREELGGLEKALRAVIDEDGSAIVIVNPHHGDLSGAGGPLTKLLEQNFLGVPGISAGILLEQGMTTDEVLKCYQVHSHHNPVLIHAASLKQNPCPKSWECRGATSAIFFLIDTAANYIRNISEVFIGYCSRMDFSEKGTKIISSWNRFRNFMPPSRTKE